MKIPSNRWRNGVGRPGRAGTPAQSKGINGLQHGKAGTSNEGYHQIFSLLKPDRALASVFNTPRLNEMPLKT